MVNKADHSENTTDQGLLRGRFSEATDEFVEVFTASISFDQRLYAEENYGNAPR